MFFNFLSQIKPGEPVTGVFQTYLTSSLNPWFFIHWGSNPKGIRPRFSSSSKESIMGLWLDAKFGRILDTTIFPCGRRLLRIKNLSSLDTMWFFSRASVRPRILSFFYFFVQEILVLNNILNLYFEHVIPEKAPFLFVFL